MQTPPPPWPQRLLQWLLDHDPPAPAPATTTTTTTIDWKIAAILLMVPLNLALLQYFGLSNTWRWLIPTLDLLGLDNAQASVTAFFRHGPNSRLRALLFWVGCATLAYFVAPALLVKWGFRHKLADYGLTLRGSLTHLPIYLGLYLALLPLIFLAAAQPSFRALYPFYQYAGRSPTDFLVWELAYALQFFSLEFFFRGFMVHGLKHRLGIYAVPVMCVPYCMIHFGKPFPETLGAIVAGLVLGLLSLRTGSIWGGVLIHVAVALTMDTLAIWW